MCSYTLKAQNTSLIKIIFLNVYHIIKGYEKMFLKKTLVSKASFKNINRVRKNVLNLQKSVRLRKYYFLFCIWNIRSHSPCVRKLGESFRS